MTPSRSEPGNGPASDGGPRRGWLLLALAISGDSGLSPVQLQRSLYLFGQRREEQVGPGFYEFEPHDSGPSSTHVYVDLDALVTAEYVVKEWVRESSWSAFRLSDSGRAWATEFRRKVKKDALLGLEDAVAWVKEQGYLDLVHKTSTIRVIG